MARPEFAHLHVHGVGSKLDGLTRAQEAMQAHAADNQRLAPLTDHGNLEGQLEWAKAAKEFGIKHGPGCEVFVAIGSADDEDYVMVPAEDDYDGGEVGDGKTKRKTYEHETMLAATKQGWRNLLLIDEHAHRHFWNRPRTDRAFIAQHTKGIIRGTGCLAGPIAGQLKVGNMEQAKANLAEMVDVSEPGHVFVEVMRHGIDAEDRVIPGLVELAKHFNLPLVATNDAHYAHSHDDVAHDAWLCSGKKRKDGSPAQLVDKDRWRFNGSGYWLKSAVEMEEAFRNIAGCEDAVRNSLAIADMIEDDIVLGSIPPGHQIPDLEALGLLPPQHKDVNEWFHAELLAGAKRRYGSPLPGEVKRRLRLEEDVISTAGFASYMLIVADIMKRARAKGIRVGAGRGSAAGSCAAYVLDVTDIDPIRYGLRFDRFLNPWRAGLPDIDMDFDDARRDEMISEMQRVYGIDHVARIGTKGVSWARDSLDRIGRVLGDGRTAGVLKRLVPDEDTKKYTLRALTEKPDPDNPKAQEVYEAGVGLREQVADDPDARRMLDLAKAIEGSAFNESMHACGVIISRDPLPGRIPLRYDSETGIAVTQWEGPELEDIGEVKFDFLAIRDLRVTDKAIEFIEQTTGEVVDLSAVHSDDVDDERTRATWQMLADGRTSGVFQIAGGGITQLTRDIQPGLPLRDLGLDNPPSKFDQLSAILALYRPGPMGAGQHQLYADRLRGGAPIDYAVFTDDADEQAVIGRSLDSTVATITYQEQLQQLAVDIADFNPDQSSRLQKAFSKKKQKMMDELRTVWMEGGQSDVRSDGTAKVAFRERTLERLWRAFEASGSYLFNKCVTSDCVVLSGEATAWTVGQLFQRLHGDWDAPDGTCPYCGERDSEPGRSDRACGACASWRCMFHGPQGFRLLAHETDGRIRPQLVKDVHFMGEREVFTVTLADGKSVRATDNHRFLSTDGYRTVSDLRVGDQLVTHEGHEPHRDHPTDRTTCPPGLLGGTARAHLDGEHTNTRSVRWDKGQLSGSSAIVSIEPAGVEDVYDVEMADGTDHNFVANGIVSHNSHSHAYAMLTWWMAYLKANWPVQFGAALLASTKRNETDKRRSLMADLRREQITVAAPDVNSASMKTSVSPDGSSVVLGLSEVKGVGEAGATVVAAREAGGPFTSLADLVARTGITSTAVAGLAEAGALDAFGSRRGLVQVCRVAKYGVDACDTSWGVLETSARERLRLDVLVGPDPVRALRPQIEDMVASGQLRDPNIMTVKGLMSRHDQIMTEQEELTELARREMGREDWRADRSGVPGDWRPQVNVVGVVAGLDEHRTGRGTRARLVLESSTSQVEVMVWEQSWRRLQRRGTLPTVGDVVVACGQVRVRRPVGSSDDEDVARDDTVTMTAQDLVIPELDDPSNTAPRVMVARLHRNDPPEDPDGDEVPEAPQDALQSPTPEEAATPERPEQGRGATVIDLNTRRPLPSGTPTVTILWWPGLDMARHEFPPSSRGVSVLAPCWPELFDPKGATKRLLSELGALSVGQARQWTSERLPAILRLEVIQPPEGEDFMDLLEYDTFHDVLERLEEDLAHSHEGAVGAS